MRRNTVNGNETPLASETMPARLSGPDLTPEALDLLLSRARRRRAEATAQLLSRLGVSIVRAFHHSAPSKHTDTKGAINREPHGAV